MHAKETQKNKQTKKKKKRNFLCLALFGEVNENWDLRLSVYHEPAWDALLTFSMFDDVDEDDDIKKQKQFGIWWKKTQNSESLIYIFGRE